VLGEQGAVAGLGAAGDLPHGVLLSTAGDRGTAAPTSCAGAGGRAWSGRERVQGLDRYAGRAASVAVWLEWET
jgi:hypothetical protein